MNRLRNGHLHALTISGIGKAGLNIVRLKVREILQDLLLTHPRGEVVQHVIDRYTHAANAGLAAAFARLNGDDVPIIHGATSRVNCAFELYTRRNLIFTFGASALALSLRSFAQAPNKLWRIGYLDLGSRQSLVDSGRYAAMLEGLRELGYVEGKNFLLEARFADGQAGRLDALATQLIGQSPDLILAYSTAAGQALQRTKTTLPIVIVGTIDPVEVGFANSLAHPGGNMTGMSSGNEDTLQKLLELLGFAVPRLKRVAVLYNPATSIHKTLLLRTEDTARKTGKQLVPVSAGTPAEIERGFAMMTREQAQAVIIFADSFTFQQRAQIAGLALQHRLPSIFQGTSYVEAGGLMHYGPELSDNFRRAGKFVDKIFKGAKPGDIPFELPTRYYFGINRKTANALGVKLGSELMVRADKVIE